MIKYIYIVIIFIFCFAKVSAQVAIGTTIPDATSILDLSAKNKGILIPRLSSSAITNPAKGLVIFNTTTKQIETNNGTANAPSWATRATGATGAKGLRGVTGASGYLTYIGIPIVNHASNASIAGGTGNTASGPNCTVTGGAGNTSSGISSTAEGNINNSTGNNTTVVGGSNNAASIEGATIGGGIANASSGANAAIVGGNTNVASNPAATNVGGDHNTSSQAGSTLVGGDHNTSSGVNSSLIGGGVLNASSGVTASISGGSSNVANAVSATVSGGSNSTASGVKSTVSGGYYMAAPSFGEWSGGIYGTTYAFVSATSPDLLDRVFNIGVGSNSTFPKDGFTILKNGTSTLPETTISKILSSSDKTIITKEYLLYKEIKTISDTNYTLLQSDCSKILQFTSDLAVTVTVPLGLKLNSKFEGKQIGSGKISFVPATLSVNLQKAPTDRLNTLGQYSTFKINWISLENYLLSGKLQAL